jgi:predicted O-methyltransferase YrrM
LEIGTYEGASAAWVSEHCNKLRTVTCIDTWTSTEEHKDTDMIQVEVRFRQNLKQLEKTYNYITYHIHKKPSTYALGNMLTQTVKYDWIYIDGSHKASSVLTDLTMAWHLLHRGGLMILDDYAWRPEGTQAYDRPKLAIDSWMQVNKDYTVWPQTNYQMILHKQ